MYRKQHLPALALGAAALVALAACGHSASSTPGAAASSAHARVSSAMANPTVSGDLTTLENNLTSCLKRHLLSPHPVADTIACVFPKGDTKELERFALDAFTPAVLTTHGPGSARDKWIAAVAKKALATQQAGAAATPAPSAKASS